MNLRDQQESGPFGRGGKRSAAVKLSFYGRLGPVFAAFAKARADRLSLKGWISDGGNRMLAHVEGPEALIGAFEMACCIGPEQALVEDWTCDEVESDVTLSGFDVQN